MIHQERHYSGNLWKIRNIVSPKTDLVRFLPKTAWKCNKLDQGGCVPNPTPLRSANGNIDDNQVLESTHLTHNQPAADISLHAVGVSEVNLVSLIKKRFWAVLIYSSAAPNRGSPSLIGDKYQVYVTFRCVHTENAYLVVNSANSPHILFTLGWSFNTVNWCGYFLIVQFCFVVSRSVLFSGSFIICSG